MRLRLRTCSWDPSISAVLTYYAAVVYGPCMMSVLLGHAERDNHRQRQIQRERERKSLAKEKNHKAKNKENREIDRNTDCNSRSYFLNIHAILAGPTCMYFLSFKYVLVNSLII